MPVIMDRAYEGNETPQLVLALEMVPVVPPKSNRVDPWHYDRALYKKRNEIERLSRRLKGFRRICSWVSICSAALCCWPLSSRRSPIPKGRRIVCVCADGRLCWRSLF
jgi:transposase